MIKVHAVPFVGDRVVEYRLDTKFGVQFYGMTVHGRNGLLAQHGVRLIPSDQLIAGIGEKARQVVKIDTGVIAIVDEENKEVMLESGQVLSYEIQQKVVAGGIRFSGGATAQNEVVTSHNSRRKPRGDDLWS